MSKEMANETLTYGGEMVVNEMFEGLSEREAIATKAVLLTLCALKDELPHGILRSLALLASYALLPSSSSSSSKRKRKKAQLPERATAEAERRAQQRKSVQRAMLGLCRTRSEVWNAICAGAEAAFGDSSPQSIDALLSCPTGARLCAAYFEAQPDPPPEPASETSGDDDEDDVPAWREIKRQARQQVAKTGESLSKIESIARFLCSPVGKQLYKEYLRQKEELIAKRRLAGRPATCAAPEGV
jgi:hypothetical protein